MLPRLSRLAFMAACLLAFPACDSNAQQPPPGPRADVWLTTGDAQQKLAAQAAVPFAPGTADAEPVRIVVNAAQTFQPIEGFGAALTNSSAWLIQNSPRRAEILRTLFHPTDGLGLSYTRLPMGASDFAAVPDRPYSYHEPTGDDPTLSQFSIAYDRPFILPVVQDALALQPALKVMGSPWSAPAWMKTTGNMVGGTLRPDAYEAFALYFVKFVQAYAAEGVPIDAITPQNEPLYIPDNYPGMGMSATAQATFIKDHLGPAFQRHGIATKILVYDHNWDDYDYPLAILNDPVARPFVHGTAWHCYEGDPSGQLPVLLAYPDKAHYFTECSGGGWAPEFGPSFAWQMQNLMIRSVRNGARVVLLWNMALDENSGPYIGGCTNCRGVVTVRRDGTFTPELEYYALGHLSKFVPPGSVRIASTTVEGQVESVAFRTPSGQTVLVALNPTTSRQRFAIVRDGQHAVYTLPPRSAATFRWS